MINITSFDVPAQIKRAQDLEAEVYELQQKLDAKALELQQVKSDNTKNITVPLKESVLYCLEVDDTLPNAGTFFLKTPSFLSECVAWNNGINVTRELKNKIASTLSFMYGKGEVGRFTKGSKSYYGLPKYFVEGARLEELKPEFQELSKDLISM